MGEYTHVIPAGFIFGSKATSDQLPIGWSDLLLIKCERESTPSTKENTHSYACVCQLLLQRPQTKVSEFRGHLVHGSNRVAGCVHDFHKDLFIYSKAGAGHFALSKLEMRPTDLFFFSPFLPK